MSYLVFARKYRPLTFGEVLAQGHVTTTLLNAIASERISHAYLFTGPRGVGKTSTARILARAVNCLEPVGHEPCNKCRSCAGILGGNSLDVIEIDGASNRGIDEIRDLRERVGYAPSSNRYKIYIIDEVHMLTQEAFNALLKTLEEPPAHVIFIFATTAAQKVPPTILSRCQRFDFKAVPARETITQLEKVLEAEKIQAPGNVLEMIARKADGAMRDALSLLDQVISFCGDELTAQRAAQVLGVSDTELFFELSGLIAGRDTAGVVSFVSRLAEEGIDLAAFYRELAEHYRNLTVFKLGAGEGDIAQISPSAVERYHSAAGLFALEDLVRGLQLILGFEETFNTSGQQRICLELLLIRLTLLEKTVNISELLSRLESAPGASAPPARAEEKAAASTGQPAAEKPPEDSPPARAVDHPPQPQPVPQGPDTSMPGQTAAGTAGDNDTATAVLDGPVDLEAFKRNWTLVIQQAKQKSVVLSPLLSSVEPSAFDGETLALSINSSLSFYRDKLSNRDSRELVCEVLQKLFGLDKIRIEIVSSEQCPPPEPQQQPGQHTEPPAPGQESFEQLCRGNKVMGKLKELFNPELTS
ncbi:MAG: DNA polymerase III subunit gamma/tau [Gemmatimonadota bacterium]|nr:DNA polymerase III subunit gamma/tau [Gemmatimonadota bacterium]